MKKTYRTININSESLFKEKQSKFFGFAFPVSEIQAIKKHIDKLKKIHHTARHFCYAYQIGITKTIYRLNDDGEPRNTAGLPIYGQIQSFDLTNILIVVVRYFGGTKLGVGGLITAYKTGAKLVLESSKIIEKTINICFQLTFEYEYLDKVMRILKERKLKMEIQKMEINCVYKISVRKKDADLVKREFEDLRCLKIKELE